MNEIKKINIQGPPLWGWQVDAVKQYKVLAPGEILVINKMRQIGASFLMRLFLLDRSLNFPNQFSVYVTVTNSNARKFFNEFREIIKDSPLTDKCNESTLEVKFVNGSQIVFKSAEQRDSLRGYTCKSHSLLIFDEMNFLDNYSIEACLPFCNVYKANILCCSTPTYKRGRFYEWYKLGLENKGGIHTIDARYLDTSMFLTPVQKEQYRLILTPNAYQTEIEGRFLENSQGIFGDYIQNIKIPEDNIPVYFGLDSSGRGSDDAVLVGFNINKEMCLIFINNEPDLLKRNLKFAEVLNSYPNVQGILIESNSMGSTSFDIIKSNCIWKNKMKEFSTSNTSKRKIVENLVAALGKKEITLLDNQKLFDELDSFIEVPLKNGGKTYAADERVANSKDDIVMATCIAAENFLGNISYGQYGMYLF